MAIDGAFKLDTGKSPVFQGALSYFPKAISAVAEVSQFGATKYAWGGWKHVDNGIVRYTDALARHFLSEGQGNVVDAETNLLEAAHVAWNALARLELIINEQLKDNN